MYRLLVLLLLIAANAQAIELKQSCPPSFEEREGRCYLVSRYQFFDSMQGKGVGGTHTGLPPIRDGFSPAQIDLGRYLFFDPILSRDHNLSCANCHQPQRGFSDGMGRSVGATGEPVKRGAPGLWNVGFLRRLFWDARATSLEEQARGPLFDPKEMANTPKQLLEDLSNSPEYEQLFATAFPEQDRAISISNVTLALAAFQSSLISLNSRYDQYALGYHQALSEQEIKGMNVYRSFVARCAECHTPPLFTNQQIAVIGTPEPEGLPLDIGAEATFDAPKLKGGFKVPSLRNIVNSGPYMHSGRFDNLEDAVRFYTQGRGHAVPEGVDMQIHWHIWEPNLSDQEITDIVAFLGALTDESLLPEIPTILPSGLMSLASTNQSLSPNANHKESEHE
ncbi:cytochrome c peroxidase [Aliiglaciecola sp. CAU 1673]|uniref:cytochrome-c peroxidase n=1 Tax=Aliiglaciecola sp. CAU 1673 TaxID=3032595 RepID=UPI0023DAB9E3|nr:cytochrome c peroxidase [Aliiglaciecola sp. CAU 1673]MDF2179011.1 cytochrome c peroxidase [Aliiglaciecola sp. CAU 1673]